MRWVPLVAALLLMVACGADGDGAVSTASASVSPPAWTSTSQTPTTMTTLASTTSTAPQATTSLPFQLVLGPDGLGDLDFGEPTASALEILVGHLGPPDPGEEYPYGGHPHRHVYWADIGLAVVFSDVGFYRDDGEEHFVGWAHGVHIGDLAGWASGPASLPLTTGNGIGIGATLAELQAAYPDQVDLEAVCDPGGPPTAAYVAGRVSSIRFSFEQLPIDATSRIADMGAGASPGC